MTGQDLAKLAELALAKYCRCGWPYLCVRIGVTAGIDLALKLVEQDFGHRVTLETAREMVVFYHRPGGQNQFGALHGLKQAQSEAIKAAQHFAAGFAPVAREIIYMATPGSGSMDCRICR